MKKKLIFIIYILVASFLLSACNESSPFPTIVNLEGSIKEIITSKGESYDFLEDELYIEKMNALLDGFIERNIIEAESFVLGNLDEDNIPEIIVFRQRNFDNVKDSGYLEVYSFNGEVYALLDRVEMNYDHSNYSLGVGKISSDKNGIYLNNKVGKGFGVTYGFILQDKKLQSILNEKKLNLISIDTINKIEDIDDDGILNFSIYTIDPECTEENIVNKNKLLLWYKWDGEDGADLIRIDKINISEDEKLPSNEDIFNTAKTLLEDDQVSFIKYLKENQGGLSTRDLNRLLKTYISNLNSKANINSLNLENLYLKYKIPLDKINNENYISSEDTIYLDEFIKKDIIIALKSGYKLVLVDNEYKYVVNYEKFTNDFGGNISNEYRDFLRIATLDNYENISFEKFIQKINMMENFTLIYPYSKFLGSVKETLNKDMTILLERVSTNQISQEEMQFLKDNYDHTYFYEKIIELISKSKNGDLPIGRSPFFLNN